MLSLGHILGRDLIIVGGGISTGLFVTLSAVCWPQYFGRKYLGSIMGTNVAYRIFFSAMGPVLFALSVRLTHSYAAAIWPYIAICVVLLVLTLKADQPQR